MSAPADVDPSPAAVSMPAELPDSMHLALEQDATRQRRHSLGFSLFWRTFFLLGLLLLGSAIGWYQLFHKLEYEPRVIDNARQLASLVNLARAALIHSDAITRVSLIKTLADQEKVRIRTHEPSDTFTPFAQTDLEQRMSSGLISHLGPQTLVASSVNNEPGFWVGFSIEGDSYWLLMDRSRIGTLRGGSAWLLWLATLAGLSLAGAVVLAQLINRPLRKLSSAFARAREGDYQERLDESVRASEIRAVNIGFNRMAEQISKTERDRVEMLAGISHDLRTPLARLRLDIEMSVPDADAREMMADDITQVDTIIKKFLDYARPDEAVLQALPLAELTRVCAQPFTARDDMQVQIDIPADLYVMGDEIELSRIFANLLENARRHGRTPGEAFSRVRIAATARDQVVTLRLRDYGPGAPPELLPNLTRPFYRGDSARTAAAGTGLGLAIVAKVVQHMGGELEFSNSPSGGLMTLIRLQQTPPPQSQTSRRR
ncbi:MAG: HAMP domain-containing protein [Burkholderiaceae bacterium]|jgi:two-component system osmolarity sensor histidine kinase EnvZ|nr:HAMP domain-containing protein [Burkholderiaceae bacterium]